MSFSKPKAAAPIPTAEQLALESDQRVQSAELSKLENQRRKRLLSAMQGTRAFRGSALFRAKPGNRAADGASVAPAAGADGVAEVPVGSFADYGRGTYY